MSDRLVRFTDEAEGIQAIQCRQQGIVGRVVSEQFNEPGVQPEHYYVVIVPLFENSKWTTSAVLYCEPKDIEFIDEDLKALAVGAVNLAKVAEDEHKEVEKLRVELANAYEKVKSDLARRAPVQGYSAGIPWEMHLRAYDVYCKRFCPQEALITGGCRGGFGVCELDEFIPGWREELSELVKLRTDLASARKVIERVAELEPSLRIGVLSDTVMLRVEYAMEWLKYHPA